MPDLIFHIGFPKCASSTIQNVVLLNEPGYLGFSGHLNRNEDLGHKFQAFAPVGLRSRGDLKLAYQWAEKVKETQKAKNPYLDRYIVSKEKLSQTNKENERAMIPFLKQFSENIWTCGEVKILLVLRNQAEKLASSYVQKSNQFFGSSQKDFRSRAKKAIKKFHDYELWVKELFEAFGREKVCVLFMEEIHTLTFWQQMKSFMQLENIDPNQMVNNEESHTHKKRLKDNIWKINDLDLDYKAKVSANKLFEYAWPNHYMPNIRPKAHKQVKALMKNVYKIHPARLKEKNREEQIELTEELRHEIQEYWKPSNQRLAELLNKDLTQLGY